MFRVHEMRIGVLALQGAFNEHIKALRQLGIDSVPVRLPSHLAGLDGLILPGGESTTISKLMLDYGLMDPLQEFGRSGFPMWGTCAGLVLLAEEAVDSSIRTLALMDIQVMRNAFGRQVDSFETPLDIPVLGVEPFPAVFIRAPIIESVGPAVEVLARLPDGPIVAARQGKLLVCAFHPELTDDLRFHRYFLGLVDK